MERLAAAVHPGWLLVALFVLVLSQLFYALLPFGRRSYPVTLALTALGVAGGQLWDWAGLPSLHFGETNLLPGLLFALALQPLVAKLVPRREP